MGKIGGRIGKEGAAVKTQEVVSCLTPLLTLRICSVSIASQGDEHPKKHDNVKDAKQDIKSVKKTNKIVQILVFICLLF